MHDLTHKHALVTGATRGIGLAATQALARRCVTLTLLARNPAKAQKSAELISQHGGKRPAIIIADFNDLDSVRAGTAAFLERGTGLEILLNNTGLINTRRHLSADGYEQTFAIDVLLANFMGMFKPLAPELNPMPDFLRAIYSTNPPEIEAYLSSELFEHRDYMYASHLVTPLQF